MRRTLISTKTFTEESPEALDRAIREWLDETAKPEGAEYDHIETDAQYSPQLGNGFGNHCAMGKVYGVWKEETEINFTKEPKKG